MSGGVDSAAAAALLVEQGHEVIGVTFRIGSGAGIEARGCCSAQQASDAAECAAALGIKHFVHHAEEDFRRHVVEPFARAYAAGLTPNPCIDCNRHVRFPTLLRLADSLGAPLIATGHYARVERRSATARYCLARAVDDAKDQSYVLWSLDQASLARLRLPVGGLLKSEAREIARQRGLIVADKPESQDICFVPHGDYRQMLIDTEADVGGPGPIVNTSGAVLGRHQGTYRYTVGQRRGLGVSAGRPLYVLAVDPKSCTVVVGGIEELLSNQVRAEQVVFSGATPEEFSSPTAVRAQMSAHGHRVEAEAVCRDAGLVVQYGAPTRTTAPGQSVVCYDGDTGRQVLCGGVVVRR